MLRGEWAADQQDLGFGLSFLVKLTNPSASYGNTTAKFIAGCLQSCINRAHFKMPHDSART